MFKYVFTIALSLILIITGFVYILKNYLINFKGSDSGLKNFMVYIPIVVAEICFITSTISGYIGLNIYKHILQEVNISDEKLALLKQALTDKTNEMAIYFIIGCICIVISWFVLKNIQKEIKRELEKPKKLWNLDKYQ